MESFWEKSFHRLEGGRCVFYGKFFAMHTFMDMVICDVDERRGEYLMNEIVECVDAWEDVANRFDHESDLSCLNAWLTACGGIDDDSEPLDDLPSADTLSRDISPELAWILKEALGYYDSTEGWFDIAVMTPHYNTGSIRNLSLLQGSPEEQALDMIRLSRGGIPLMLDLGGFAKGFALDRCVDLLRREGAHNALLNFGNSSVFAMGNHPFGEGWKVGRLAIPGEQEVCLHNEALTTSGNKPGFVAHILNPNTRERVTGRGLLSVVTKSAAEGEALSTAAFAADNDARLRILQGVRKWF